MLPDAETAYLAENWPEARVSGEGSMIAVEFPGFEFPEGYMPRQADLLLLLPFGFPDAPPDMFWVHPEVTVHGFAPAATEVREPHLDRVWQRFSRHLAQGMWRPGTDGLRTYIALITTSLRTEAAQHREAA